MRGQGGDQGCVLGLRTPEESTHGHTWQLTRLTQLLDLEHTLLWSHIVLLYRRIKDVEKPSTHWLALR